MASLSLGGAQTDTQIQEKRKNFMTEIRDALIAGDVATDGQDKSKKTKKKKQKQKLDDAS